MNYREFLHKTCTETDMDDREEVTVLIQFLLQEAVEYHDISMKHENKLKEIMSAKDYDEYLSKIADEMTREWVENLPDSDLKDFAVRNLDIIMNDELSFTEAFAEIREREAKK